MIAGGLGTQFSDDFESTARNPMPAFLMPAITCEKMDCLLALNRPAAANTCSRSLELDFSKFGCVLDDFFELGWGDHVSLAGFAETDI